PLVSGGGPLRGRSLAVAVPLGAPRLYTEQPARARAARLRLRRLATRLFARGYEAADLRLEADRALYVFERPISARERSRIGPRRKGRLP
ncbi:MAG TPA: hypothetical protein VLI67_02240, partial [Vicinamibacteria bacterium]|nr:hypothetical protein [Vicinamibacteria bacterium]